MTEEEKISLQNQLTLLNDKVKKVANERKKFLDLHQYLFAEFPIGADVYNIQTGQQGKVIRHYRYYANQNPLYDNSFDVDCEIQIVTEDDYSLVDNTSCYAGLNPYVLYEDFLNSNKSYINKLQILARRR